jgi:DNA polymerase-3 subunit delta'
MIIGHQKIWQFLEKSTEKERLSHAYLFSGQEKLGKKTLALEWLSSIFGEDISKGTHPDFVFIEPINKEIQISQIKGLILRLSLKPFVAPLKAAIIDQAHAMNQEAQNCFLKTLEEPKGETLLILITEYPEALFPTILSRCENIKFYPIQNLEIEKYLETQGIAQSKIREIVENSRGKPGVVMDFISNPQKIDNQKKYIEELIKNTNSDIASRFQYAKNLSQENNLREVLDIWLDYFRNILLLKIREKDKFKDYTFQKLKNILQKIQNTNFLISTTNINSRLALETLMLEL